MNKLFFSFLIYSIMNRKITLILPLFILGFLFQAQAQCPTNIDFELGTTANWLYYRGTCSSPGAVPPTYTLSATAAVPGLHTITTMPATDYYGGFPVVAPAGGGAHSLRLGKDSGYYATMRAEYNVHVPTGPGVYSLLYRYAAVLENPTAGHTYWTEPRFVVKAFDSLGGPAIACDSYTYVGDGTQPGFLLSMVTSLYSGAADVYYKTWTMGNMKFPGLGGHTVTVQFTASGCTQSGHFGYGYVDMSCGFYANSLITCASGTTTLLGPDGFSAYNWYDSTTWAFVGSGQSIVITSPTVTATYAVVLTPYSGYGCPDTLYTRVVPTSLVTSPTHDTAICSGTSLTLTAGATSLYTPITYLWGPSSTLSCSTCSSPIATPTVSTNYWVKTTDASGCTRTDTIHVTLFAMPTPIAPSPIQVCLGSTLTLTDGIGGGTWSSSNPALASVTSTTGILTGVAVSTTAIVTYTLGGSCRVWAPVTVNPNPLAITGTALMCVSYTTTLYDATPGGTWSVSSGIISVGSTTGVVTGIAAGTATVTYTVTSTGCYVVRSVTVSPTPSAIVSSSTSVCVGGTLNLLDITPGGTWSCSPLATGTINSATGVLAGIAAGVVTVTYTTAAGCSVTANFTVNPIPTPISGPIHVCVGDYIILSDATAGGSWLSVVGNAGCMAPLAATTDTVIGISAGTDVISYVNAMGCAATYAITINPLPPAILGSTDVCLGSTLILMDLDPGGTWACTPPNITIGATTGIVTGVNVGSSVVTYTNLNGCKITTTVNVSPLPDTISGPHTLCVGTTITLTDATFGGTWGPSIGVHANVSSGGVVTGTSVGPQTITYTGPGAAGCYRTFTVTVQTTPPTPTGILTVCQGMTTILNDVISGGIWTITPTTIATIIGGVTTATVTGVAPGTATVTYALGVGCSASVVVTVSPMPGPITPSSPVVCVGSTITLADPTSPGGTWGTAAVVNASIGAVTGIVLGISAGPQVFTYTAPTGCIRMTTVNVNALPLAIAGPTTVCVNSTITLTDPSAGGTWVSMNPAQGTISPSGGVFVGILAGTATVKYTLATGCSITTVITVNPIPPLFSVTGGGSYCAGGTAPHIYLSGSTVGATYQLKLLGVLTGPILSGTGLVLDFGPVLAAGVYSVVATYPTSCSRTMTGTATIIVNPLPVITGPTALCVGATMTEVSSIPGSTWTSSAPGTATIGATTGIVTGISTGGPVTITCTSPAPAGCSSTVAINVSSSPTTILGPSTVCVADSITLSDAVPGGIWTGSTSIVATVGSLNGHVVGNNTGVDTITYSLGSGCTVVKVISVNPQPALVTATTFTICQGGSTVLHDGTPGGTWSVAPGSTSLATVNPATGNVTAIITGGSTQTVATILYTITATGCRNWAFVTINPLPAPITAPSFDVCVGSTLALGDVTPGGSWSISPTTYGSINAITGVLTGNVAGSPSIVSYTVLGCSATASVTVNPLPSSITGTTHVCQFSTVTLSSTSPGGAWTIAPITTATITPTTGNVYGLLPGAASVTYTLPTGCARSMPITVNPTPSPIFGPANVCVGYGAVMTDPTPGGAWSSTIPLVASIVASTGIITTGPSLTGPVTISYTVGLCAATTVFTVLAPPAPIAGPSNVCVRDSILLTDITPGGIWSSGNPILATISATGEVHGIASGTVVISYGGASGCFKTTPIVINPMSDIIGDSVVCIGQTILLTDTSLGGNWSSLTPAVCSVGSTTGIVTGVAASTSGLIEYLNPFTGCKAYRTLTVNSLPTPITGPSHHVCLYQNLSVSDLTPGGSWSSSNSAVAPVSGFGVVTGAATGSATITYTLATTGCFVTYAVTVDSLPANIVGPDNMCVGSSATYTDGSGAGTWLSTVPAYASFITGSLLSGLAVGTTIVSFTLTSTGCVTSKPVNIINPPSAITSTGPAVMCVGSGITLYDATPLGTWSSSAPATAYIDATTGYVTGLLPGTATITYSTGLGCNATTVVTVNPTPGGIAPINICVGDTRTLSTYPFGGTWTSSIPFTATIGSSSGLVTGMNPGTTVITYTLGTGCALTTNVNVDPSPPAITGIPSVCVGQYSLLADALPGGTWASSNTSAGTVDATGNVYGVAPGTTDITYTMSGTVCPATMHVTVNPVPYPITGVLQVCVGLTTTLHDAIPGTGWSSLNPGVATVSTSGVVTGIAAGTSDIVFTLGASCFVTATVTVIANPAAISGTDSVCQGQFLFFTDATPSGKWVSSDTLVATIDSVTGVMGALLPGYSTIKYTVNGCSAYHPVTVDVQPAPITGNPIVCIGGTSHLYDATPTGLWTSTYPAIAPVNSTGIVFGNALGASTITYTIYPGGCKSTLNVNVVPLPVIYNVIGGGSFCAGGSGVLIGLSNSAVGVNYMLYRGTTATGTFAGTGSPISFGLQTVGGTYTVVATTTATGCSVAMSGSVTITVIPTVTPAVTITPTPNDTVCAGTAVTFAPNPVNGGAGPVYQWSVNGTLVSTSNTYAFIPANGDVVSVTMTSNAVCPLPATGTGSMTMTVQPFVNPSVSIAANPNDTVCQGTIVSVTANPVRGGSAPLYTWMLDGAISGTGSVYTYVPVNHDVIYCIMNSNYPCRLSNADTSANIVFKIDTALMPVVSISVSPNTLISAGQPVTMTASVVNGGSAPTYQWYNNSIPAAAATNAVYVNSTLTTQENDSVSVQVTNNDLCKATGHQWVFIQVANVGVHNLTNTNSDISVVPNPNKGDFIVKGTLGTLADETVSLEITDVLGQVVYNGKVLAKNGKLNEHVNLGSGIANGMYMLSVRTSAESKVFHLVIEQ